MDPGWEENFVSFESHRLSQSVWEAFGWWRLRGADHQERALLFPRFHFARRPIHFLRGKPSHARYGHLDDSAHRRSETKYFSSNARERKCADNVPRWPLGGLCVYRIGKI